MSAPSDSSPAVPTPSRTPTPASRGLLGFFYTHNPFYLLSVCCVLHGGGFWIQNAGVTRSEPLIFLIAGYIVILAFVAWLIVRLGKVWEDARSILLLIPLLFVEFSLALDDPLLSRPTTGWMLAVGGYLFALIVTEGLLRGLRIRLPGELRLPLHALLGLMMLYPLALTPIRQMLSAEVLSWRIYGFFPLTALVILTLIPAIRRGPGLVRDSRTPWRWPWFPWTIFTVLLTCVLVRGYALSLSYDPVLSLGYDAAMRLDSAWGAYFLAPVILALGWLFLEFGIVSDVKKLQQLALAFPLVCLGLSVPLGVGSIPQAEFHKQFTHTLASPIFVSLIGGAVFYWIAAWRKVPDADAGLAFSIGLFAVIGPETLNWQTPISPQATPLILAGLLLVVRDRHSSLMVFAGLLFEAAAIRFSLSADFSEFGRNAIGVHLAGLAVLIVGLIFRDAFGRLLRFAAAFLMAFACVFAQLGGRWFPPDLPSWIIPAYTIGLAIVAFTLAYRLWDRYFLAAGCLNLALFSMLLIREAYRSLHTLPEWPGIASFGLAFLLLLIGGAISAVKAGLLARIKSVEGG